MRRLTLFVSAILMALFTALLISTAPVGAQESTGTATRDGEDIIYNDDTYELLAAAPSENEDFTFHSSACRESNGEVYVRAVRGTSAENGVGAICIVTGGYAWYVWFPNAHPADDGNSLIFGDGTITEQDMGIIIAVQDRYERYDGFPPSLETAGEPQNLDVANPRPEGLSDDEWDAMWNDIYQKFHANIHDQARITIGSEASSSTCDGEGTIGIGWVVCPVTRWMAVGMDALFGILRSFLEVEPLSTNTSSPIYLMWGIMRNIANILFIIGFLIIIYSQITNIGISNYGLKRLLPRLVISAILVNLSFIISAIAVDLSNIFGATLYELLTGISRTLQANTDSGAAFKEVTWEAVSGAILSAGAAGFIVGGAVISTAASAGASLWLLLITLAGVILSALVAILLFAARQALITIFVVISPLAFVAYILPGTEKYFDRWRFFFFTMLVLYPILSFVFGGAQLAGWVIILGALENPDNRNFYNLIILGMVVQVSPVFVTPMLIKFGGSLLGRIAGIVNDPNKGIVDKTRKFATSRQDMTKNRRLWDKDQNGYKSRNPLSAYGRWNALREKDNASKLEAWQGGAQAAYGRDRRSNEIYKQNKLNEMIKSAGDDEARTEFAREVARDISLRSMDTQQRVTKAEADFADSVNKTAYDAITTRPGIAPAAIRELANRGHEAAVHAQDETQRQSSIHLEHENEYWAGLASDLNRQRYAGAEGIAEHGETRIANIVRQKQNEEREKRVNAAISNLATVEAHLSEERAVILNDVANAGRFVSLTQDVESRAGALRRYVGRAPLAQVQSLMAEMDITMSANGDAALEELRSELAGALQKRKPFYLSQTNLNKIEEGTLGTQYFGPTGKNLMIQETLNMKGLGTQTMVQVDRDDLQAVRDYLRTNGIGSLNADAQASLRSSLRTAFADDRFRSQMDKRAIELTEIWNDLGMGPMP